jgi:colanic acid/amylovoran biosynthesis protein
VPAHRDNRPPRFILTGTFHSGNRGDASMQMAAAAELRSRRPDAEIVLLSCDPAADAPIYPDVRVLPTSRRRPGRALLQIARLCLARVVGMRAVLGDPELRAIAEADMVIDLSGDGFTETFGWKCPASHAVPLIQARLLGVPSVMMAQTIGPFHHGRVFYRGLFRGVNAILCRDAESIRALADLDVAEHAGKGGPAIKLTADVAFLLEAATAAQLAQSVPWLEAFPGGAPLVGVTPSNLFNVRTTRSRDHVLELLAAAADRLADLVDGRILIIPTVFGPGASYDDRRAGERLLAMLRTPGRARLVTEELPPRELKALIGRCALYTGVRMHGLIHALSQAIPCIGLAYGEKTRNLFRRLDVPDFAANPADVSAEQCAQLAERLRKESADIGSRLQAALAADILPAARANFDALELLSHVP